MLKVSQLFMLLFFILGNTCFGQDCRMLVANALDKVVALDLKETNSIYQICTTSSASSEEVCKEITYLQTDDEVYWKTSESSTYSNKEITISVFHDVEKIHVTNAKGQDVTPLMTSYKILYDSLIAKSEIQSCFQDCKSGVDETEVTFLLEEKQKKTFKINSFTYQLLGEELREMRVNYTPGQPYKVMTIAISPIQVDKVETIRETLKNVLTHPESLKKEYTQYQFIDKRI